MDILEFSFNAVAPITLMMLIGVLLRKVGILSKEAAQQINKLCFTLFIPCKLFQQVYDADLHASANMTTLGIALGSTALTLIVLCILVPRFVFSGPKRGEMIQGIYRGNAAILGIPLIENLYGAKATAALAIPMPIMLMFYNVTAPIVLTVYAGGEKTNAGTVVKKVITNPFLIGVLLGLAFNLLNIPLPKLGTSLINSLSNVGTPMALIGLGAVTEFHSFKTSGKLAAIATALRLIFIPAIILIVAVLLGLREQQLAVMICFFSTPTAVGGYVLAKNIDHDGELAGQILVLTTVFSVLTMFGTIALLRGLGYM